MLLRYIITFKTYMGTEGHAYYPLSFLILIPSFASYQRFLLLVSKIVSKMELILSIGIRDHERKSGIMVSSQCVAVDYSWIFLCGSWLSERKKINKERCCDILCSRKDKMRRKKRIDILSTYERLTEMFESLAIFVNILFSISLRLAYKKEAKWIV